MALVAFLLALAGCAPINSPPMVAFIDVGWTGSYLIGDPVVFRAECSDADPGAHITKIRWDFGDATPPDTHDFYASGGGVCLEETHVYESPGSYTATFSAMDEKGSWSEARVLVTIARPPCPSLPENPTVVAYFWTHSGGGFTDVGFVAGSTTLSAEKCAFLTFDIVAVDKDDALPAVTGKTVGSTPYECRAAASGISRLTVEFSEKNGRVLAMFDTQNGTLDLSRPSFDLHPDEYGFYELTIHAIDNEVGSACQGECTLKIEIKIEPCKEC